MTQRINYMQHSPELFKKLMDFSGAIGKSTVSPSLRHLVDLRASQLNGCAFCVDMHTKEAIIDGERPLRLHHVAVLRECLLFSVRERAALEWTEAETRMSGNGGSA